MATNWLQLLKNYIGTEGATSLADKLTVARAGYIDNINNADISTIPNISTLSVARIGYIDNINQVGLLQVTAVRAGYLDNINNANLSTIPDISSLSAARIGYLDELAAANLPADIAAIPTTAMRGTENAATVADGWDAALATILDNFTAARIGYLDELDFDLQTAIAAIPTDAMRGTNSAALASSWTAALATALASYTAVRGGYLDELAAANLPADIAAIPTTAMRGTENAATVADGWDVALATILDNFTAARVGYLDNINNANLSTIPDISSLSAAKIGYLDNINNAQLLNLTAARLGYIDNLSGGAAALEASITAIKGGGWSDETLVSIQTAIDSIAGVNTYMEQIPDSDFALAAIDNALTADPPSADAENSVIDIDQEGGSTFVLRSLWVNITSFGTAGTKLTFALWVLVNSVVTQVDSVDVESLGIQSLMDLFALQDVHADGIWVTVITDSASADAACSGTYRYAKAS